MELKHLDSLVLEYRLYETERTFTPLYHYTRLPLDEVLARRECEFFVKDGVTYKQRSSALEDESYFLIYVDRYENGNIVPRETDRIKIEVRELNHNADHPVLESYVLERHLDALAMLGTTYLYVDGLEFMRDSTEVDEDRGVYVLYVTPTGLELEDSR